MSEGIAGLIVFLILLAIIGVLALAMKMRRDDKRRQEEENLRRILKHRYGGKVDKQKKVK